MTTYEVQANYALLLALKNDGAGLEISNAFVSHEQNNRSFTQQKYPEAFEQANKKLISSGLCKPDSAFDQIEIDSLMKVYDDGYYQ